MKTQIVQRTSETTHGETDIWGGEGGYPGLFHIQTSIECICGKTSEGKHPSVCENEEKMHIYSVTFTVEA